MIYIDNLSEFVRVIINNNLEGVYLPQNKEYVNITELVKQIADSNNKKIFFTKFFNKALNLMRFKPFTKLFGSLIYSTHETIIEMPIDFKESIKKTEGSIE